MDFDNILGKDNLMKLGFGKEVNGLIDSGKDVNNGYVTKDGKYLIVSFLYKVDGSDKVVKKPYIFFKDNPTMVEDTFKTVREAKVWVQEQYATTTTAATNLEVTETDVTGKVVEKKAKKTKKAKKA